MFAIGFLLLFVLSFIESLNMKKIVEKKEAKSLNRYSDNRIWYWSKIKLI
mgnify:CR=1 FL=1